MSQDRQIELQVSQFRFQLEVCKSILHIIAKISISLTINISKSTFSLILLQSALDSPAFLLVTEESEQVSSRF